VRKLKSYLHTSEEHSNTKITQNKNHNSKTENTKKAKFQKQKRTKQKRLVKFQKEFSISNFSLGQRRQPASAQTL